MPRSRTRSKKSRPKKVLVKRGSRRSTRSPVTRSYTQPYRRYRANDIGLTGLTGIASSEEALNFVESSDIFEELKETFNTNIAVLQVTGTNTAINKINELIAGMIEQAEEWQTNTPEKLPGVLPNIKQELEQQAHLIHLLLKPN